MDEKQETSMQILEAASKRFMHYGYNKTAMAEIARDLKMSTGNLYRFFVSKLDIAEAIATKHGDHDHDILVEVIKSKGTAIERLYKLAHTVLTETYNHIAESNKVFEMAQAIISQRPEFANQRLAKERGLIVAILNDGIASGEFREFEDVEWTAEVLQCATMKYRYPQIHHCYNLEYLRKELDGVISHLIHGLAK
ncbi:MAG: TetR/AcrR family transcriptional regulator [Pseudomonadota bacterium]